MAVTNQPRVQPGIVVPERSSARTLIVPRRRPSAMERMIVVMVQMNRIATCHVRNLISSAALVVGVSWTRGDAMAMPIARMAVMRIP